MVCWGVRRWAVWTWAWGRAGGYLGARHWRRLGRWTQRRGLGWRWIFRRRRRLRRRRIGRLVMGKIDRLTPEEHAEVTAAVSEAEKTDRKSTRLNSSH